MSFLFWQRWLVVVSAASALLGFVFVVAPGADFLTTFNLHVLETFHDAVIPGGAVEQHAWSLAVMGSSILGWGILLTFVAAIPYRRREPWAWYCIALSVLAWVVTDTVVSYEAGVLKEVVFNGFALVAFALPLRMTFREMTRRRPQAPAVPPLYRAPDPARPGPEGDHDVQP